MANDFNQTVGSLFQGMDSLLTTKTVVGEPTKVGDTIILPLVDVNFGVAAGAFGKNGGSNSAGGGMGGKMSPTAVLVIQNGHRVYIPEVVDKIATAMGKKADVDIDSPEIKEAIDQASENN